ncbi:hypothetical protein [Halostreptopolyspora alba]|uniref:Uncharacterized protein n=1 Tax=Halostreptopolyspora alba TaxID=2487137 RepID=A0A3N0EFG2_9ACTN|nr:hypothetical protein EFW17_05280 [Nocardiopsaceae bacterium YIM 96095]
MLTGTTGAFARCALTITTSAGTRLRHLVDDHLRAGVNAAEHWLLAADVIIVPGEDEPREAAAAGFLRYPGCRVIATQSARPTVFARGADTALPARSNWEAQLAASLTHSWLAAGGTMDDLASAWPTWRFTPPLQREGRPDVAVSLRLAERGARCRWRARG